MIGRSRSEGVATGAGRAVLSAALPLLLLLPACEAGPSGASADLVIRGARVVTVDSARPVAEAVAVSGDTIAAVGSEMEVAGLIGSGTEVLRLDGGLVIPGFIEGHGHFMSLGRAQTILDLSGARTWGEIVSMVADAVGEVEPGEWIRGRGWHQEKWDRSPRPSVQGLPVHTSLSRAAPQNPVLLGHASGHMSFANAAALAEAGITAETPDPPGGAIVRDARGAPTGALRENAQDLVAEAFRRSRARRSPEEVRAARRRRARLAAREALSKGITTFHDAGVSFETVDLYRRLADEGELPLRLYVMVRAPNRELEERLDEYRMVGYGGGHLTVRSIKQFADGALGSHGAWLLEPYADMPESEGHNVTPMDSVRRTGEIALEHGYQLNTHAIGTRANREVLDIYESLFRSHPEREDLRWRIEHAQHIHPDDIPRFGALGVIASMQAIHACSDAPWVVPRLGPERARQNAYVWRELLETGAVVMNGTDAPVEDVDPLPSVACAVARELPSGERFFPGQDDQRMSREEALRSYTLANAYGAFEEESKGSLARGKLADIVVLSKDITAVPPEEITTARVLYTIVGGTIRYRAEAASPEGGGS